MGKEVEELVKRLRRRASDRRVGVPNVDLRFKPTTTLLIEAADTIESLRASLTRVEEERDAIRKIIEPFVEGVLWSDFEDTATASISLEEMDLHRLAELHARLSRPTSAEGE